MASSVAFGFAESAWAQVSMGRDWLPWADLDATERTGVGVVTCDNAVGAAPGSTAARH